MDSAMLGVLLFTTVVAGLIYVGFMLERIRLGRLEAELDEERTRSAARPTAPEGVVRV
jgi:hypothetical protein